MITEYNDIIGDLIDEEEAGTLQMTVKTYVKKKLKLTYVNTMEITISTVIITKAVGVKLPKICILLSSSSRRR